MRTLFLDTETTGLDPRKDRLLEVCLLEYTDRLPTGRMFHAYLNPGQEIDRDATRVHGIETADVQGRPTMAMIAEDLVRFCRKSQVVAHNADFDVAFLDTELLRAGRPEQLGDVCTVIDTLTMARQRWPGKANNLNAVCQRLKIDTANREVHGALVDAQLLAEAYLELTRGQFKIGLMEGQLEIRRWQRPAGYRLPIIEATPEELSAHKAFMKRIRKAREEKRA